jgi:hypothetical protein
MQKRTGDTAARMYRKIQSSKLLPSSGSSSRWNVAALFELGKLISTPLPHGPEKWKMVAQFVVSRESPVRGGDKEIGWNLPC